MATIKGSSEVSAPSALQEASLSSIDLINRPVENHWSFSLAVFGLESRGYLMKKLIFGISILCAAFLVNQPSLAQENRSQTCPGSEISQLSKKLDGRFKSYLGKITRTTAKSPFQSGAATALLLSGPTEKGRFTGEWRQLGALNISVEGKLLENGRIRLIGNEFEAVCQDGSTPGGLSCLLNTSGGASVAQLEEGESGDPNNPDCVSCVDERAAGCCQGTGECCTYCAPADECNISSGGESEQPDEVQMAP